MKPYRLFSVSSYGSHFVPLVVPLPASISFIFIIHVFWKCDNQIEEKYARRYTVWCEKVQYEQHNCIFCLICYPLPQNCWWSFFLFEWFGFLLTWEHWVSVFRELSRLAVLLGLQKSNTWKVSMPELRYAMQFYSELLCNCIFWYLFD